MKQFSPKLNADKELSLLLACSRVQPLPEDVVLQKKLAQGLDSQRFLALTNRHRVVSMVWHNLKQHPEGMFAPIVMQTLAKKHQKNTLDSLAMTGEMLRLHRLLGREHIPYTTLKGLPVALIAYGEASLRHARDIDILVPESEFTKTCQLLTESGYVATDSLSRLNHRQLNYFLRTAHDYEFISPRSSQIIELHWRPKVDPRVFSGLSLAGGSAQLSLLPLAGEALPLLADDEMLLYLCAHGAEHAWFRLKWVFDLPLLLENRAWDWERLFQKARDYKCEKQLALGFVLAHRLLGWSTPAEVETWVNSQPNVIEQYEFVLQAIHGPETWWQMNMPPSILLSWLRYRAGFVEGLAGWWLELLTHATTRRDWDLLPLPSALFFLYFPLRPFLLSWRLVKRCLKNRAKPAVTAN